MLRALVTGAGGFIGYHLVSFLRSHGYWVRGIDLEPPLFGSTTADEFELMDLRSWPNCLLATKHVDEVYWQLIRFRGRKSSTQAQPLWGMAR